MKYCNPLHECNTEMKNHLSYNKMIIIMDLYGLDSVSVVIIISLARYMITFCVTIQLAIILSV